MQTLSIQTSMDKNRQVKFNNGMGIRHEIEAKKLCEFMFAYIPSGNYRVFISMVVDKMYTNSPLGFNKQNVNNLIAQAIDAIAKEYMESKEYHSHDEEVMPVPNNMTDSEWEVVLARTEQVESN